MEERRKSDRAPAEIEVHFRTAQEFLSAYTQNISGGGMFVKTSRLLALNEEVLLRFTLPGISHRFDIPGLVVWSNPTMRTASVGMGIKFMKVDPAEVKMIEEFVKKALATMQAPEKK